MRILPIFIPHLGCPFHCIYCDQKLITKSVQPDLEQIKKNLADFCLAGDAQKEIAFYGGTFTALSRTEQKRYFDLAAPYLSRISGIRISTRPDFISDTRLLFCRQHGVSTLELGIQSFSDPVLKASARGYSAQRAAAACRIVKSHSFQLGIQLMPGLPGFNAESLQTTILTTIKLKPDFVRLYPTIVLADTELHKMYSAGKYEPLSLNSAIEISAEMISAFEQNGIKVIKTGLHSDLDQHSIIAGPYHESLGEMVRAELLYKKIIDHFSEQTLSISPLDISLFKGFNNRMLTKLKKTLKKEKIPLRFDPDLAKGNFLFTDSAPQYNW